MTSYDLVAPPWAYTAERSLALQHAPWMAGEFVWTGFDYIGEPTPYGWPSRSSYFGIVDLAGFPKDRYYFYQSVWRPRAVGASSAPLDLAGPGRQGDSRLGRYATAIAWSCSSTASRWARRSSIVTSRCTLRGRCLTRPGPCSAVAKNGGKEVANDEVRTAGKPLRLMLRPDRDKFHADGDDISFVAVFVVDADGRVCPEASNLVWFHLAGPGTIAGVDNGDPTNHESFKADKHTVFHGLGLVVVGAGRSPGKITLRAEADGLEPAEVSLEAEDPKSDFFPVQPQR